MSFTLPLTGVEYAMAKAACAMSAKEISQACGIGLTTLAAIEKETASRASMRRMRAWFEAQGLIFGREDGYLVVKVPERLELRRKPIGG